MNLGAKPRRRRFRNWAATAQCTPVATVEPATEASLRDVVRAAFEQNLPLKVAGAGHSWSDVACSDGLLVRLGSMNRLLELDRERAQVTVEGGMRLRELDVLLRARGLAMSNLGSISEQTVAGAIATGTHGTGVKFGSLSTQVVKLRLMTARGELLDIGPDEPQLLAAARLSLGALGIVTRVTLQCERAFDLYEHAFALPLDEALERLQGLVDAHDHVKLWWLPHTGRVQVFLLNRVPASKTKPGLGRWGRQAGERLINRFVFAGLLKASSVVPSTVPIINRVVSTTYFRPRTRTDASRSVFNVPMPPAHSEIEYGIDRALAAEALRQVRAMIEEMRLRVNFVVEVRFVAADDILLSGAYGRDSCQIGAYMAACDDLNPYFAGFEDLCIRLGGRPHWGKHFRVAHPEVGRMFPGFDSFRRVRSQLDPWGRFDNAFLRRVGLASTTRLRPVTGDKLASGL